AIETLLTDRAQAKLLGWSIAMEDGGAALLRYTLDLRQGGTLPDVGALDAEIELMVRGWEPALEQALALLEDDRRAATLAHRFAPIFPQAYRLNRSADDAARDALRLRDLTVETPLNVRLCPSTPVASGPASGAQSAAPDAPTTPAAAQELRLKVYAIGGALPLSGVVPALENFGFTVVEEVPTALVDGRGGYIHDFLLTMPAGAPSPLADGARIATIEGAVADVLGGAAENDAFNQLVIHAGLNPVAVVWLRAWFRYLRQTGISYSLLTVVQALRGAPVVARALVDLFTALHGPDAPAMAADGVDDGGQNGAAHGARAAIATGLDGVAAIDEDRILRLLLAVVDATLRTNAFAPAGAEALAFKLDSAAIPGLPRPVPWREIFVYSPRVEGIHLRAGPVARGGLRWSDRRDDFRTEILGLMKAQRVKNAVIVPTGAKGGFYPKNLPDPAVDRDAWLAEGTECYRVFIRTLLSITDNLVGGAVVHPAGVIIRDGADPYFVVAADKGTATFSDVANAIALERDFWLGDAFASGGSNGYDHKAMGITARGAWLSVQRHLRELGVDVQADAVRVVGVGDMSGDVFGNGMLLSQSLHLIAAFDHRHIFIDPTPDAAASWAERSRLFALPRSSWADYDAGLISPGGGVFARSQKIIPLSPQAQAALGVVADAMEPAALMAAILRAPADLLWFGGIGTYVKSAAQGHSDVGDPANDRVRVDAETLRARVVGEGANLGITQAGRIAFSLRGGRINTDFIDNSAGVDCSDNEVNIKIALNKQVRDGHLAPDDRNQLLASMTDDVAALVLADNRMQALALSIAERGGVGALPSIIRLIEQFEADGRLDRAVEGLASNDELLRRAQDQRGLTRPELAVLLSTAKLGIQDAAEQGGLGADALMDDEVLAAFPPAIVAAHRDALLNHQLRNEIVATKVANRMINRMGLVHPFELAEEEGVGMADVAQSFVVAEKLFGIPALWSAIDGGVMDEQARLALYGELAVELRAQMADLIRNSVNGRSLAQCVADLAPGIAQLESAGDALLPDQRREQAVAFRARLQSLGSPPDVADALVHLADLDGAIGIIALSRLRQVDPINITAAFTALGHATALDWAQGTAMTLAPTDPWERLLVAGLARDFQQMRPDMIARLPDDPAAAIGEWLARNAARVDQFRLFVDRARAHPAPSPAMLAQLAGQARALLARP
ncbi:MAG: NAD-glutamate dehydrogenase domain-containing protein, partial [Sphingopyxis sp.]